MLTFEEKISGPEVWTYVADMHLVLFLDYKNYFKNYLDRKKFQILQIYFKILNLMWLPRILTNIIM